MTGRDPYFPKTVHRRPWWGIVAVAAVIMVSTLGLGAAAAEDDLAVMDARTVTDSVGRRVEVPRPFSRIVSLYGAHTENLFSLGLDQQIIGVSGQEPYPPAASEKPIFSYHDDPEKFLAARPDLVLTRPMIDRGYPDLLARLEKSGITVVSLQPGTVQEMQVYWEVLGILTGRQAEALDMQVRFEAAVEAFRALTGPIQPKKRVYFEAIHGKMKTFTPQSMAVFALECAGGINIAADAEQVRRTNIAFYGKERILAKAGQIDVFLAQKGTMNQPDIETIRGEPGFHAIKAVRDGQIFILDETIIARPTLRLLLGIFAIGSRLYPEVFDGRALDILEEAGLSKASS